MGTTKRIETPAFTIEDGTVTRESGGSRTTLRFAAGAQRHLEGAGFEVNNVRAVMYGQDGRFIAKRGAEGSRTVLSNNAAWVHEVPVEQLVLAKRFTYEIEYRFDLRRKLTSGELPPFTAEADGSDYWRWLVPDARALDDRTATFELGLWARSTEIVITYGFAPKLATDSFRNEFELDLLDANQRVVLTKNFSGSLNCGRPSYDDTSIYGIDRRLMHTLKFYELRVRSEVRGVAELEVTGL